MDKRKISPQSLSFIILFLIAVLGTYGALLYAKHAVPKEANRAAPTSDAGKTVINYPKPSDTPAASVSPTPVSTANWELYTDARYNFSFSYPLSWKVASKGIDKNGYYVVALASNTGEARIYLSREGYLGMAGLESKSEKLAGMDAINFGNIIYGIKHLNYYYTFDLNTALDAKAEFKALVNTVQFPAEYKLK